MNMKPWRWNFIFFIVLDLVINETNTSYIRVASEKDKGVETHALTRHLNPNGYTGVTVPNSPFSL